MKLSIGKRGISGNELQRLIVEEVDAAVLEIARGVADPKALHEARKILKKLRALALLVRPALGEEFAFLKRVLRENMRLLVRYREMDALLQVLAHETRVAGSTDLDIFEAAVALHQRVHVGPVNRSTDLRAALHHLQALREAVGKSRPASIEAGAIRRRLRRSVKRARTAQQAALASTTTLLLHDLRKKSKVVLNQLRLLRRWWGEDASEMCDGLVRLDDHLGRSRDVGILAGILVGLPAAEAPLQRGVGFRRRLEMVSREEAQAALELGAEIFRKKPRKFVRRALK